MKKLSQLLSIRSKSGPNKWGRSALAATIVLFAGMLAQTLGAHPQSAPPDSPTASSQVRQLFIEGQQALQAGHLNRAAKDFHRILALDPNSASAHYQKARALEAMGRREEAQKEFAAAAHMQKATRDRLLQEISSAEVPETPITQNPQ
ncbi:MAG TPA: tetratricopeptide repeat protein [Terriglobia bacterium]|nr:tetratricopeptide repeat protein [Terriglobia bacterium]HVB28270.1 tetratricopeptide repeat protein [Terriglobia bacterium]